MDTVRRLLAVALTLMLALPLFPALAAAEETAYAESTVDLPEGYSEFTGLFARPDGSLATVARDENGNWNQIVYSDLFAAPEIIPLGLSGSALNGVAATAEGEFAVLSYNMPMGRQGDGPMTAQDEGEGGPVLRQGEGEGGPVMNQMEDGDLPREGAMGEGGPIIMQSDDADAPKDQQMQGGEGSQVGAKSSENRVIMGGNDITLTVSWFAPDGSAITSFELSGMPMHTAVLSGRRLAVLSMEEGLTIYDEAGNAVGTVDTPNMVYRLAADADALYAITGDNTILIFDGETYASTGSVGASGSEGFYPSALATFGTTLYGADSTGIYALNGEETEKVVDGIGTYFGDPLNGVSSFVMLEDGSVVALIKEGSGGGGGRVSIRIGGDDSVSILAVYRPMDPAAMANRETFTVTALRESTALLKAVSDFQRKHPELKVVLDAKMGEFDESPTDDMIRTLNTDLLAGKGGDVLILDGLPLEKYVEKGILADLTETLSDVDFLPGIQEGSKASDGKLYAMPARFSFDTLWGKGDVIASLSSLDKLIETPVESGQTILYPYSYGDWMKLFYPAAEAGFRDEAGDLSFDNPEFSTFLELLYELYVEQGEEPSDLMEFSRGASMAATLAMVNGSTALYPTDVTSLMSINLAYTIAGGVDSGFTTVPTLDGQSLCYQPALLVGVNERSGNPEAARDFARSMFELGAQELETMEGLPVTASAIDKQIEEAVERSKSDNIMQMIAFSDGNPIEMKQTDEETLRALREMFDELSVPNIVDDTLMGFIIEETESFFKGQIDAQSAAQAVQQRAWSYLNE